MKQRSTGAQGALEVLVFSLRLLATIIVCGLILSEVSAQGNSGLQEGSRAAQLRALNNNLLQLHGQAQENAASVGALRGQAAAVLAERAATLQALMQENPKAALSLAFSPELLADLAEKFPQSASSLEAAANFSGVIETWTFDGASGKPTHTEYRMKVAQGSVRLHFAGTNPNALPNEAYQLSGIILGSEMVVAEAKRLQGHSYLVGTGGLFGPISTMARIRAAGLGTFYGAALLLALLFFLKLRGALKRTTARQITASAVAALFILLNPGLGLGQNASCTTTGVQNTAVILVTFPGVAIPTSVTTQSLNDIFFNSSNGPSLDGFLRDASAGQTSAAGSVFGPFTLAGTYSSCSDVSGAVLDDAIAAATAGGANLGSYSRVFLIFPDVFGCGWAGFASNSCSITAPNGNFNASVAYIATAYVENRASAVSLASHELGHNFGLMHSGTVSAGTQALGPLSAPGTWTDMGDYWSSMGETVLGTYPVIQRSAVLGWMKSGTNYITVQSSGTYTLQPVEATPAALQALRIQRGTGNNAWLWVEYRQPIDSYDATLFQQPFSGALIHYEDQNTGTAHSYLPNFTPSDTTGNSPALAAGQTWSDPYSNVSISVLSASSSGLTVSVNYSGAPACTSSAPTVSASPLNPSIYPGQTASYAVSVTNNDSTGCGASTINLSSTEPSGWTTALSSSAVTLSPGQSANLNLGKGAPNGIPAGTYAINLVAANNSASAADTANVTVVTPPSLAATLSVSSSAFSLPTSVPIMVTVTNGGAPVAGASVTIKITPPSGNGSSLSSTTNQSGVASFSYKTTQKSPAGTYSVVGQATIASGSRKNATTQSVSASPAFFVVK